MWIQIEAKSHFLIATALTLVQKFAVQQSYQ